MNKISRYLFILLFAFSFDCQLLAMESSTSEKANLKSSDTTERVLAHDDHHADHHPAIENHHKVPTWSIIPFVLLLLMIATGPLFYEHFWHKSYPYVAMTLAAMVVSYYLFALGNSHAPIHALAEYVQFISLLAGLYIASGGIMINVDRESRPLTNIALLITGAIIANIIGTTGASMLLIRPFIRLNKFRIKPYHIVFFIIMVSNIGGSLTPIGDPPLFLGFLKGVPFFWTLQHNLLPWFTALSILVGIFYVFDKRNKSDFSHGEEVSYTNKITITGAKNFFWLGLVVCCVFLDPNVFDWVPAIHYHGQKFSFLREVIMLLCAFLSFKFASKEAITGNDFSFEPIREVTFIFIGIFGTMMPALEIVSEFAKSEQGAALISHNTLYWGTGVLSGFLDNAPTYMNFLTAAMASNGLDINNFSQVIDFSGGSVPHSILMMKAISVAAVFFGSMTYIGNGPNFMVKSIAEQVGIKMPSFFGYIIRFSIPILLPLFFVIWIIFFAFQ